MVDKKEIDAYSRGYDEGYLTGVRDVLAKTQEFWAVTFKKDGETCLWSGLSTLGQIELFRTPEGAKLAAERVENWRHDVGVHRVPIVNTSGLKL